MTVVLSLIAAAFFGAGDFCGGLAARRTRLIDVMLKSHIIGLVLIGCAAVFLADAFAWRDFGLGALGGVAGLIGLGFLYRRLAAGPMSVVAPITAVVSAAVPTSWGLLGGESFSGMTGVGVALAFVAIAFISLNDGGSGAPVTPIVIGESLLAGLGFGTFFIFLDATNAATSPWPVVGSRAASVAIVVTIAVVMFGRNQPISRSQDARTWGLIAAAGIADAVANVAFLSAANRGDLALVAVLSALYPASTMILARLVLDERMTRLQQAGFALAVLGTALISAG